MLFNSFEFLLFLPCVFFLYWFVFKDRKWQNAFVVIASYVFYGWWDWRFLFLIAITSLCSYLSGLFLEDNDGSLKRRKAICAANIILNLAILGVFKYYNFFLESIVVLCSSWGYKLDWVTLDVILPVGISFYTFQALSYTIDVYRGSIRATHDVTEFFAYICFFPQLVAGPIERATNLLPQFQRTRVFEYEKAVDGCRQMMWGFFKKLVVADNCAAVVNQYWNRYDELSGLFLLFLGVLFAFQIYCDFSGYSDIAIGCSRLFGFNLKQNFNYPYFSRSIPEFWRRWHISLMTWFRDYVYFPLGGSKCSKMKTLRNVFIVWGISGLWHGANWTFVCWGLYHGTLLAVYNILGVKTRHDNNVSYDRFLPNIKEFCQMLLTFLLAVIGWIIFRSDSINQAISFIQRILFHLLDSPLKIDGKKAIAWCVVVTIVEWFQKRHSHALQLPSLGIFQYSITRYALYLAICILMFFFAGEVQTFIYFQF